MSRIAIDAREWSSSTGRYINSLVRELEKIDTTNEYQILLKSKDFASWQPVNQNFQKLVCDYKEFTISEQLGYGWQLKKLGSNLVHFGMTHQPVLYKGKTVTTINDLTTLRFNNPAKNRAIFWFKQRVYGWVKKRVARKSKALITYSHFVKEDIVTYAGIDPNKVTVINLAADKITAPPEPIKALIGKSFLLYVGRALPHKNLERLLEAFVLAKAKHPELLLVLGGKKDANYERLESQLHQRTIKNVIFTDYLQEGQLRWLYENCSAYVFPSLSEGFGLPGLEAMAHGAPVISSNATCLPEIYGDAAQYFNPTDPEAIANSINEVLNDDYLRQELITRGKDQVKKYSWRRMAEQTLEVYRKALQN